MRTLEAIVGLHRSTLKRSICSFSPAEVQRLLGQAAKIGLKKEYRVPIMTSKKPMFKLGSTGLVARERGRTKYVEEG